MKNDRQFNEILNTCLDRIINGETIEQCLRSYPEQAKALEPLLRTALAARMASTIQPRPEFKARARYEFQAALHQMESKQTRHPWFSSWRWQWHSAWAMAVIAILIVIVGGGSTIAAAASSMPDSALYPVKLATEKAQMALTFSDIGKAELNAKLADKRVDEIVYLAAKGDSQEVQAVAMRLNSNLENINNLVHDEGNGNSVSTADNSSEASNAKSQTEQTPMTAFGQAAPSPAAVPVAPPAAALGPDITAAAEQPVPSPAPTTPAVTRPPVTSLAPTPTDKNVLSGNNTLTVLSPYPGAKSVSVTPTFAWSVSDNATGYDLQVADNPIFENMVVNLRGIETNDWSATRILNNDTTYYWRVRPVNTNANKSGDWVQSTFTTLAAPTPRQTAPPPVTTPPPSTVTAIVTVTPKKFQDPKSGLYFNSQQELDQYRASHPSVGNIKTTDLEKLKQTVIKYALQHPARLEEALSKAPPEVRPALRQAITQALAEYDKLIKSIEKIRSDK